MRVLTWSAFPGCGYVLKENGSHVGAMDVGLHRCNISGCRCGRNVSTKGDSIGVGTGSGKRSARYSSPKEIMSRLNRFSRCNIKLARKELELPQGQVLGSVRVCDLEQVLVQ